MEIIVDYPPAFKMIDRAFRVLGKPILYSWVDTIYNPMNIVIPPQLIAHEQVHGARQRGAVIEWWKMYCESPGFRLVEEVLAHRAEYHYYCAHVAPNRQHRQGALKAISQRLAGPLYNNMIKTKRARELVKRAATLPVALSMIQETKSNDHPEKAKGRDRRARGVPGYDPGEGLQGRRVQA